MKIRSLPEIALLRTLMDGYWGRQTDAVIKSLSHDDAAHALLEKIIAEGHLTKPLTAARNRWLYLPEDDTLANRIRETLARADSMLAGLAVEGVLGALTRVPGKAGYRKPRLFVATLRYSRRSFRRVVWNSSQETWARLHEQAWRYFGGSTRYVVLDNLKEGVLKPDLYRCARQRRSNRRVRC